MLRFHRPRHQAPEASSAAQSGVSSVAQLHCSARTLSENDRLHEAVRAAISKLRPFADARLGCLRFIWLYLALGAYDGIGVLSTVASLHTKDLTRAHVAIERMIEDVKAQLLNYLVIMSLLLTILVALIIADVTDPPEYLDGATHASNSTLSPWSDGAVLFSVTNVHAVQRILYALNVGFVYYGLSSLTVGLWRAILLSHGLGVALPDIMDRALYLMTNLTVPSFVSGCTLSGGLASLVVVLPLVAARTSVVAFFCALAPFVVLMVASLYDSMTCHRGILGSLQRAQHERARALVAQYDSRGSRRARDEDPSTTSRSRRDRGEDPSTADGAQRSLHSPHELQGESAPPPARVCDPGSRTARTEVPSHCQPQVVQLSIRPAAKSSTSGMI